MIIKKFKKYIISDEYHGGFKGRQVIYRFPNDFGASIIDGPMLHLFPFWVELAVLYFRNKDDNHFSLTYETGITNDVLIIDDRDQLEEILKKIYNLKSDKKEIEKAIDEREEELKKFISGEI